MMHIHSVDDATERRVSQAGLVVKYRVGQLK